MNKIIIKLGLTISLLNINLCAMNTEKTYLFSSLKTANYNDLYKHVQIAKPLFYHLVVQASKAELFIPKPLKELIQKIEGKKIDTTEQGTFISMTNKDAFNRLLCYIPSHGQMQKEQNGHEKYSALINDIPVELIFGYSKLKSTDLAEDDDGICTMICSDALSLDKDKKIVTEFETLIQWLTDDTMTYQDLLQKLKANAKIPEYTDPIQGKNDWRDKAGLESGSGTLENTKDTITSTVLSSEEREKRKQKNLDRFGDAGKPYVPGDGFGKNGPYTRDKDKYMINPITGEKTLLE